MDMCPSTGRALQWKSTVDFVTLETVAESYFGYVFMSCYFERHDINKKFCNA
jgi:hypothetical protein